MLKMLMAWEKMWMRPLFGALTYSDRRPIPANWGAPREPEPGDFAVVKIRGWMGDQLTVDQELLLDPLPEWDHALVYVGDGKCVEAMPWGVDITDMNDPLHEIYSAYMWSTGRLCPTDVQRKQIVASAERYVGRPYNNFEMIEGPVYSYGIWPWNKILPFIMRDFFLMCSQTVAQTWANAGFPLCDGLWPGYVTPGELAGEVLDASR